MPPIDGRPERIAAQVEAALSAIDAAAEGGARYWYTPAVVKRVDDFNVEFLLPKYPVLYLIRPGDAFSGQRTTGTLDKQAELFVLGAALWRPNTRNPYEATPPIRWTIQNRLRQDLETCLEGGDLRLGGAAYNLEWRDWSYDVFVEDGGHLWAPIIGRLMATYRHERGRP